jgi:M6 family metalloprotease-like protein
LEQQDNKHADTGDPFNWNDYDMNSDGYIDNLIVIYNGYDAGEGGLDPVGTPSESRIFAHAGFVNDRIWVSSFTGIAPGSYATASAYRGISGNAICRINFVVHEFLHTFGVIDLYDLDFVGYGCGLFDVMAFPNGQQGKGKYPGNVGPYTKIVLGWLEPIEISQDGTYIANPSFTSTQVYKISAGYPPGEYLLIENRQPLGWEPAFWGGGGIVIWSIDETADRNDGTQTRVKVIQADGRDDLEEKENLGDADDLWITGRELEDTGYPNSRSRRTGQSTNLRIYDFSATQTEMEFSIGLDESPTASPTSTPDPTGTPAPEDTPAPVDTAAPADTPAPVDTAAPADTPAPIDTAAPADTPAPVDTAAPADTPVPIGTTAPGDPNSCAVSLNTEDCLPLLAATTPEPDCDCYNYCGNVYL